MKKKKTRNTREKINFAKVGKHPVKKIPLKRTVNKAPLPPKKSQEKKRKGKGDSKDDRVVNNKSKTQ